MRPRGALRAVLKSRSTVTSLTNESRQGYALTYEVASRSIAESGMVRTVSDSRSDNSAACSQVATGPDALNRVPQAVESIRLRHLGWMTQNGRGSAADWVPSISIMALE